MYQPILAEARLCARRSISSSDKGVVGTAIAILISDLLMTTLSIDLLDLLSRRIRGIDGVRSTETFMYLKLRKQTYSWGTE